MKTKLLILCALLLVSCNDIEVEPQPQPEAWFDDNCQGIAIYSACVASLNNLDYIIVYGKLNGIEHMHTKVYVDNEWFWTRKVEGGIACFKELKNFEELYEWDLDKANTMITKWNGG